jgi:hypothetical protein
LKITETILSLIASEKEEYTIPKRSRNYTLKTLKFSPLGRKLEAKETGVVKKRIFL